MPLRFLRASATLAFSLTWLPTAHAQAPHTAPSTSAPALAGYHAVYRNPFVAGLRQELDGYLALRHGKAGKWHGQTTVNAPPMEFADLGKVDSQYLSSRFTVYTLENEALAGGRRVLILFIDKPDRIFKASMYLTGDGRYELRGFKDSGITPEAIATMRKSYEEIMLSREHAL